MRAVWGADVSIVYRRSEAEMPARKEEVHHAKEEGIHFRMLTNPKAILGDENGFVRAMTCVEMELGEPDERGRRRPVPKPGSEFELPVETVVVAIGNSPNPLIKKTTPDLPTETWGGITTDEHGRTGKKHVYAGGDAVTGAATVILAMGAGKKGGAGHSGRRREGRINQSRRLTVLAAGVFFLSSTNQKNRCIMEVARDRRGHP